MATFEQIINATYKQLGEPSDSINYDQTDVVRPKINEVVDRVCKGSIRNVFNNSLYTAGDLPFRRRQEFYTGIKKQTLNGDTAIGAVTINFDSSDFPTAGYVMIDDNIIQYTGNTGSSITGCTNVVIEHFGGTYVYPLYTIPTNISKPFTFYHIDKKGRLCEMPYQDRRYPTVQAPYYSIVQNNDDTELLLIRGYNGNDDRYVLNYYINSVTMVDNTDVCVIPDPYALMVIPAIAAGELLYDNEEIDDASTKLNKGYGQLQEMYQYYATQNKKNRQFIQVAPMNLNGIYAGRYGYGGRKNYPW